MIFRLRQSTYRFTWIFLRIQRAQNGDRKNQGKNALSLLSALFRMCEATETENWERNCGMDKMYDKHLVGAALARARIPLPYEYLTNLSSWCVYDYFFFLFLFGSLGLFIKIIENNGMLFIFFFFGQKRWINNQQKKEREKETNSDWHNGNFHSFVCLRKKKTKLER